MPSSNPNKTDQLLDENLNTNSVVQSDGEERIITIDRRRPDSDRRQAEPELDTSEVPNRRKKQRRRHIDPTTCERDYSDPEIEFMQAMDDYKRRSGRMFPTCSEVLEVVRNLGYYRLTADQIEDLGLGNVEEPSKDELEASEETLSAQAGANSPSESNKHQNRVRRSCSADAVIFLADPIFCTHLLRQVTLRTWRQQVSSSLTTCP